MVLNEQQAAFLEGTRAADSQGRPLVLYHGTPYAFDRFERTKDLGFHFGSLEQARRRLLDITPKERRETRAGPDRILAVALKAENPLVVPDDPCSWNASYLAKLFGRFLTGADRKAVHTLVDARRPTSQDDACRVIRERLLSHGHDAILYRNQFESQSRSRGLDWSWLALRSEAILHLGVDRQVAGLHWPDDRARQPGIDPMETVTRIGGLRRRNSKLAKSSDRKRFVALASKAISRTLDAFSAGEFGDPAMYTCERKAMVEGRGVTVVLFPELGRMDARVDALGSRTISLHSPEAMALLEGDTFKDDLEAALGDEWFGKGSVEKERLFTSRHWEPGEPLEDAVASFDRDLRTILSALRPRPEAGMPDSRMPKLP